MREIKFRVWNKTGEFKMLKVFNLIWEIDEFLEDNKERLYFRGKLPELKDNKGGVCSGFGAVDGSEESMWELMQYTGLKDKNGKEIYEGDILEHEYSEVSLLKVVFARGGFNVVGINLDEPLSELLSPDNGLYRQSKVIGNIYENPELLGGTDGRD